MRPYREATRTDADDRDGNPTDADHLPDRVGITRELALPEAVAEDSHEPRSGFIVFAREETTEDRIQTECLVEATGDDCSRHSAD